MIKSLITKGILNDGNVTVNRTYELPLSLELNLTESNIDLEIDREISISLKTDREIELKLEVLPV